MDSDWNVLDDSTERGPSAGGEVTGEGKMGDGDAEGDDAASGVHAAAGDRDDAGVHVADGDRVDVGVHADVATAKSPGELGDDASVVVIVCLTTPFSVITKLGLTALPFGL